MRGRTRSGSTWLRQAWLPWLAVPALLSAAPVEAAPPPLYHSYSDTGGNPGVPATLAPGSGVTLHLYLDLGVGETASTADPCNQGDGDELCGYRLRLTSAGADLQSFTPADPDVIFNLAPDELQLTGGDFQNGELGPTKIGDLVLDALGPSGSVDLVLGEYVTTRLEKEKAATPTTIVLLPEPGRVHLFTWGAVLLLLGHRHRSRSCIAPAR